jgi:hypothetical protein
VPVDSILLEQRVLERVLHTALEVSIRLFGGEITDLASPCVFTQLYVVSNLSRQRPNDIGIERLPHQRACAGPYRALPVIRFAKRLDSDSYFLVVVRVFSL